MVEKVVNPETAKTERITYWTERFLKSFNSGWSYKHYTILASTLILTVAGVCLAYTFILKKRLKEVTSC